MPPGQCDIALMQLRVKGVADEAAPFFALLQNCCEVVAKLL
jgi:hypothetical protein